MSLHVCGVTVDVCERHIHVCKLVWAYTYVRVFLHTLGDRVYTCALCYCVCILGVQMNVFLHMSMHALCL